MFRLSTIVALALVMLFAQTIAAPMTFAEPVRRSVAQLGQITTPTSSPTATVSTATATPSPTSTPVSSASPLATVTAGSPQTGTTEAEVQPSSTEITATLPTATPSAPLEGTIIANRSANNARFFVEGVTYDLEPGRSLGLALPRASSVLNLYNCDSSTPETESSCFWDPYLVTLDGFYEIYNAPDAAAAARLLLREAGSPPTNQVWVQNRTTQTEQLVYRNETRELAPTSVLEVPVESGVPAILYVRSCLTLSGETVCEWAPKTLEAGVYYAMVLVDSPGSQPGSQITTLDLRPIVAGVEQTPTPQATSAQDGSTPQAATPVPAPIAGQINCRLLVPTLNVRSGPGLLYDIIDKVRSGEQPGTVAVDGRSVDSEWLTVVPGTVLDGWITASTNFITCDGNLASLPMVEAPAPPPTPELAVIPEPAPGDAPAPQTPAEPAPDAPVPGETTTPATDGPAIPPGQAVLLVNNGFDFDIRFTLDQRYRPLEGPSEYDLAPGASVAIVVFPGQVDFSASSPWSGLSGNASLHLEADQSLTLWLRFIPDPGGSDQWTLVWQ